MKLFTILFFYCSTIVAQVGIGTSAPSSGSLLDIKSAAGNKGILIPRIDIEDLNTAAPVTGDMEESLLVYNTNILSGKGFYFWNGSLWQPLDTNNGNNNTTNPDPNFFWKTTGNLGTDAGTNSGQHFLGTWDDEDLVVATNTVERMRVKTNGNVGVGENNPDQLLHISTARDGQGIKIQRGNDHFEMTQNNRTLDFNSSNNNGAFIYSFAASPKLVMDNNQFYPAVNSVDNVNNVGYDLGIFSRHFRRVYTQGVHTNDNDVNGGLRINIGSNGNSTADYMFSDFAHFPVLNGVKDLGRNGNAWGDFYFQNAFRVSDKRRKKNIKIMKPALTTVMSLNTYEYQYINDKSNRLQYGFMAQELQEQIPSIVDEATNEEKSLAVDYGQMIPLLVKSIQEQQKQIEALKKEVSILQTK